MSKKEKKVQKDTGPGLSSDEDISSSDHKSEYNEEDYQKLNDDYLRLAAEFENYKKRISKDQESIAISTISMFALSLLPLVDSFENALEQGKGNENIKEWVLIDKDGNLIERGEGAHTHQRTMFGLLGQQVRDAAQKLGLG